MTSGFVEVNVDIDVTPNPVRNATAFLHATENLSSQLLLGCDFLMNNGAVIDVKSKTVTFYPEEAQAIHATNHPLFLEACSLAYPHKNQAQEDFFSNNTYTASPAETVRIGVADSRQLKVKIDTCSGLLYPPGAKVMVSGSPSGDDRPCILDGIYTVGQNRKPIIL